VSIGVAVENALSARNRTVDVDGETLVYRRLGNADARSEAGHRAYIRHVGGRTRVSWG
jgi:hypothetical protein